MKAKTETWIVMKLKFVTMCDLLLGVVVTAVGGVTRETTDDVGEHVVQSVVLLGQFFKQPLRMGRYLEVRVHGTLGHFTAKLST